MEQKNEKVIRVVVNENEFNALVSTLNLIASSDDSPDLKEKKRAEMIRDSILKYRKPCQTCRSKDGKGFMIFFLESEAAVMIQYFGMITDIFLSQK